MIIQLGDGMRLDLQRLIETRMLLQANSGGGKSWALRRILEQSHGHVQQIVIDIEDEFYTLRERMDYILVRREGGDCIPDVRSAPLLAIRLLELGVSTIISIYEMNQRDRRAFVCAFITALTDAPKTLWHPMMLVLDEAHRFCEEKGRGVKDDSGCADAVINFMAQGRKRGFFGILATQRISKLHKDAAAEANNKLIGRASLDVDMKRAGEELGFTRKEDQHALRSLAPGEFFAFGPALCSNVKRVLVGGVKTTHPRAGVGMTPISPARSRVLAALAKLGDVPKESEVIREGAAHLRAENVRLTQLLADAETKLAAAPAAAPLLDSAKVQELLDAAKALTATSNGLLTTAETLRESSHKALSASVQLADIARSAQTRPAAPVKATSAKAAPPMPAQAADRTPRLALPHAVQRFTAESPKMRVLRALRWLENDDRTPPRVAFFAGYKVGGHFSNTLGQLRKDGLLSERGLDITDAGRALVPDVSPKPVGAALREWIRPMLEGPENKLLDALIEAGGQVMTSKDLSARVQLFGGHFSNTLGKLRKHSGAVIGDRGGVRAAPEFFQ